MMRVLRWWCVGLALVQAAHAQILDEVNVKRQGGNAVVDIRFAVQIQYLRSAMNTRRDRLQVFFRVTAGEDGGSRTIQEFRRSPPTDLVQRFTLNYPFQPDSVTRRLDIQFEKPVTVRVRPGPDNRSIRLEMAALTPVPAPAKPAAVPAPAPAKPAAPADAATREIARKALALLGEALSALDAGHLDTAIEQLNALLNLPPNSSSREAQELIGVARERSGETAKARAEFELFLKLYPEGADAKRVRARLAALSFSPKAGAPAAPAPPAAAAPRTLAWGSVSQYYYGGQSHSDTQVTTVTPATNATTIDTLSLTSTDQSALVSNVDLNARYTSGTWDDRLVLRDTHSLSFLKDQPNLNRLTALYAEARHVPSQSLVRIGRQSSTFNGVLGRFDGLVAGYGFGPRVRVSLVGGRPVDEFGDLKPNFYGVLADFDSLAQRWSGSVYGIEQRIDGHSDRRAVGSELRYFDSERSLLASIDYDLGFHAVNIATVQAAWQVRPGTTLNLLGDYRRAPSLQLSNALLAGRNLTLQQLLETFGEPQTRSEARDVTPVSKVLYAGLTHAFNPRWQLGADVRLSSLSAVPEVGLLPATPGTGNVFTYSTQLVGSSLWGINDVVVLNVSYLTGPLTHGFSAGLTERLPLGARWVVEPSLRYYRQHDDMGVRLTRTAPGFKLSYRLRDTMVLEGEATFERTRTVGPRIDDDTLRHFYFLGYRWDF